MVANAVDLTIQFSKKVPMSDRKNIGQYFTCETTAIFMADLLHTKKTSVRILDPGAGSGILSVALVTNLVRYGVKEIALDVYETDANIIPVLIVNIETLKQHCLENKVSLIASIKQKNYILDNKKDWQNEEFDGRYDLVICNPPYKKINANAAEAQVMSEIIYGQPNLYFLFMAMALKQLMPMGELSFIIPRSWTAGAYFRKFRQFLFANGDIRQIHLFKSRNKVFQNEDVLQETIIIHVKKGKQGKEITISESDTSSKFSDLSEITVPTSVCIAPSKILFLPLSVSEVQILKKINGFDNSLKKMGLIARTGKVVDFRNKELLSETTNLQTVPLLWASNFDNGKIVHPCGKEIQFIENRNTSLLIKNSDYIFIKRFSSKEETKRLQTAVYFRELDNEYIAAENHLNYIDCTGLDRSIIWGLFAILDSHLWDSYIRLFNGSTQINAGDLNDLPLPPTELIEKIGEQYAMRKTQPDQIISEIIQ